VAAVAHTGGAARPGGALTWALRESRAQSARSGLRCPPREGVGMNATVVRQFYALMKPRVIQLIVFCALIGMVLAVPGLPTWATCASP
jgi:heme O synthase-like polyprenyltransferase